MEYVVGDVEITDIDAFLDALRSIGADHGAVIQAIDARYVAGEAHLERAVQLSMRARERGEAIATDPALEILLYAAGTRQIEQALELGVSPETQTVAIVIVGGDEKHAVRDTQEMVSPLEELPEPSVEAICDWFDITERERNATTANLEALVCERVALLPIER